MRDDHELENFAILPDLDEGIIKMVETEDSGRHSQLVQEARDQETHSGGAENLGE